MKWTKEQINLIISSQNKTINDLRILTGHSYRAVGIKIKRLKFQPAVGYIDGDGSISYSSRDKTLSIQVAGTKLIMNWFKKYFDLFISPVGNRKPCNIYQHGNIFGYGIGGKRGIRLIKTLGNFAIAANIPRMERKWNKIYEYAN